MDLRDFIKHFTFKERDRDVITLGPSTRLNPTTHRAQLAESAAGTYSTDAGLYVKTWLAQPQAVREWRGFEAYVVHKKIRNEQVTSLGFRLSNGTDEFYWTGSEWEVNTVDWNTEAEVADNISSFSAASRKLQVVVNLATSNELVTPELIEIRVLYGALLDSEIEDIVFRSFVPALRSAVRSVTRFIITKAADGDTIALDDFPLEGDYRVVGVDAAFNYTDDPGLDTDLFQSHTSKSTPSDPWTDGTVDVITLSSSVDAGKRVWLRLQLEPVVADQTSRDWYEVEHLPSLLIESVSFIESAQRQGDDYVGNRNDATAKLLPGPTQGTLQVALAGITDKIVDSLRLGAVVNRYFGDSPTLVSTGLDESYRLRLVDVHDSRNSPNEQDVRAWRKVFYIEHFCVWDRASVDAYLVKRFQTTGNVAVTVE